MMISPSVFELAIRAKIVITSLSEEESKSHVFLNGFQAVILYRSRLWYLIIACNLMFIKLHHLILRIAQKL